MPAYNAARYIAQSIRSVKAQTFTHWELIIVDDGSTDDTLLLAHQEADKDPRIKVFASENNAGNAFPVRLKAAQMSTSSLIAPLDADDLIEPTCLETLLHDKQSSGARIAYPTMWRFKDNTADASQLVPACGFDTSKVYNGRDLIARTMPLWQIGANGGVIDKSLYLECIDKVPDPSLMNSDEYLTRVLLLHADMVKISSARYYYRHNDTSITRTVSLKPFDILTTDTLLMQLMTDSFGPPSEEYRAAAIQQCNHVADMIHYYNTNKKQLGTSRSKAWQSIRQGWHRIDWNAIRNSPGWKIKAALRLGPDFAAFILKLMRPN